MSLTVHEEKSCEEVDASVFSGDICFRPDARATFKEYVGRWTRAIEKAEGNEIRDALEAADRLCKEVNWGPHVLDENAAQLLNEAPALIAAALELLNQKEPK